MKIKIPPLITNVMILGVTLCICFLVLELIVRVFVVPVKVQESTWPAEFNPRLGFVFKPNSTLKWSNVIDYSVTQKANSVGFLDYEHSFEKPRGTYRVLLLGDSFIEAVQVETKDKIQAILQEKLQKKYPFRKPEVIALGFSGCGTSNVLSFYEELGRKYKPDLVVIVFVYNDFANNSPLLESIRNGWDPYKSPRLFFEKKGENDYARIDIDPDWGKYVLKTKGKTPLFVRIENQMNPYLGWSTLYRWLTKIIDIKFKISTNAYNEVVKERIAELRQVPSYRAQLSGWKFPDDLDMDLMIYAENMPPVFEDAVGITDHIIKVFKEKTLKDGAKLVIMANAASLPESPDKMNGRKTTDKGYMSRIKKIADQNNIPLIDLNTYFSKRGDLKEARWRYDAHWNKTGHSWAADALFEYLDNKVLDRQ